MEQQNATPPLAAARIAPFISIAERVLLGAFVVGAILFVLGIDDVVATFSIAVLAVVFFLRAYVPAPLPGDISEDTDGEAGFSQLLALSIVPKVLWISCAISAVAITFHIIEMPRENYRQMLMIGGLTLAIGSVMMTFFMATGMKHIRLVAGVLFRAIPLCALDIYLLVR